MISGSFVTTTLGRMHYLREPERARKGPKGPDEASIGLKLKQITLGTEEFVCNNSSHARSSAAFLFPKSQKMFGSMMLYASSVNVTTRYIVLVCCCSNIAALGYLSSLVERLDSSVSSHIPQQKTTLSKKCSCSSRLTHASDVGLLHCKIISIFSI